MRSFQLHHPVALYGFLQQRSGQFPDNRVPGQQVGLTRLRSDGRKINHSRRTRRSQGGAQRCPNRPRPGKPRLRIKVWRNETA